MTFSNLNLNPQLIKAVAEAGYLVPTSIQSRAIPEILDGVDIRASAQTGTGKTAAFLLPAIHRLTQAPPKGKGPRVLILAPTRELAMQIAVQGEKYSKYLPKLKTVCIAGGLPSHPQLQKLARPHDILIATPGRLIDFLEQKKVNLSQIELLVLDEADRMLDMGFIEPVEEIVKKTPSSRQTLLFSATLQGSVKKLSERIMNQPIDIVINAELSNSKNISQKLHFVNNLSHKNRLLDHILGKEIIDSAIVFTSTKRHADQLVEELYDKGHQASALHGDMSQRQRTRAIMQMRKGKIKILVATDVAARGIDIQSISHVINFDLPRNVEDYVHRIGRTGRAGAKGTALSFVSGRDGPLVKRIEAFLGKKIDIEEIAGFESSSSFSKQKPRWRSRSRPKRPFKMRKR